MKTVNQISVFVENKMGSLEAVTGLLARAGIDVRAFCIADTTDFGILRMIVDRPDIAEAELRREGISVSKTPVLAVRLPDRPGAMHSVFAALSGGGIGIDYAYAFVSRDRAYAYAIVRAASYEGVAELLEAKGITLVGEEEMYAI